MKRVDKLAIAVEAIKRLPALARHGTYSPATVTKPAWWECKVGGWLIILTEQVLLSPTDPALSMLLDICPAGGGPKVFSASWMPDQPWVPPRVVQCKAGSWQDMLLSGEGTTEGDKA